MFCVLRQKFEIEVRRRWHTYTIPIEEIAASFGLTVPGLCSELPHYTNLSYRTVYLRGIERMKRLRVSGREVGFPIDNPPDEPEGEFDRYDVDYDDMVRPESGLSRCNSSQPLGRACSRFAAKRENVVLIRKREYIPKSPVTEGRGKYDDEVKK